MTTLAGPRLVSKDHMRREMHEALEIIGLGKELVPMFCVQYDDGLYRMLAQLPENPLEREVRFGLIKEWFSCGLVLSFTFTAETKVPDALSCIAVSRQDCLVGIVEIDRLTNGPKSDISWHGKEVIDDVFFDLIGGGTKEVDATRHRELLMMFSEGGPFPFFPMVER